MSETNQNQGAQQKPEETKFAINVEQHEIFDSLSESVFTKSSDFGQLVNALFGNVYADYEGCRIELDPTTNRPAVSLIFNHLEKPGDHLVYACSKEVDANTENETIRRLRAYENRVRYGDQYNLTKDGMDGLAEFITWLPRTRDKAGNIQWKNVVTTIADNTNPQMMNQQYTSVNYVDINLLAKKIYGEKVEGSTGEWIYVVTIKHSAPGGAINNLNGTISKDYALEIFRVNSERVEQIGYRLGFGYNTNGLNIIRAITS